MECPPARSRAEQRRAEGAAQGGGGGGGGGIGRRRRMRRRASSANAGLLRWRTSESQFLRSRLRGHRSPHRGCASMRRCARVKRPQSARARRSGDAEGEEGQRSGGSDAEQRPTVADADSASTRLNSLTIRCDVRRIRVQRYLSMRTNDACAPRATASLPLSGQSRRHCDRRMCRIRCTNVRVARQCSVSLATRTACSLAQSVPVLDRGAVVV